jgi:purine-binding chemotaxis protein CheW
MVSEIVKVPEENIEDTPPSITGFDKRFLSGVAKVDEKLILMLDLTKVLSPDEENDIKEFIDENKASVLEQD